MFRRLTATVGVLCIVLASTPISIVLAQDGPELLDPDLGVRTVATGLTTPTTLAFIGPNDFLVLEKNTGQVKRVTNGAVTATVLDLDVNTASERGVLGIALHPNFPTDRGVYLYRTESTTDADSNVLGDTAAGQSRRPFRSQRR